MACSRFERFAGPENRAGHRAPLELPPALPSLTSGVRGHLSNAMQNRGARFSTVGIYEGRKAA